MMMAKIQCLFSFFLLLYNHVELRMHCSATQCGAVQCCGVMCVIPYFVMSNHEVFLTYYVLVCGLCVLVSVQEKKSDSCTAQCGNRNSNSNSINRTRSMRMNRQGRVGQSGTGQDSQGSHAPVAPHRAQCFPSPLTSLFVLPCPALIILLVCYSPISSLHHRHHIVTYSSTLLLRPPSSLLTMPIREGAPGHICLWLSPMR